MNSPKSPTAHIPLTNTRRGNNMARLLRNNTQTNNQKFRAIRMSHLNASRKRVGNLNTKKNIKKYNIKGTSLINNPCHNKHYNISYIIHSPY